MKNWILHCQPAPWAAVTVLLLGLRVAPAQPQPIDYHQPPRRYHRETLRGRHCFWEISLWQRDPATVDSTRRRFLKNLEASVSALPYDTRGPLRRLPVYLMDGPRSPQGGRTQGLEYFRQGAPQFRAEIDPNWSDVLVVYSAHNYLVQNDLWARKAVQHELAHAFHLHNWAEDQPPELMKAYQNACRTGLYRYVADQDGPPQSRAYALTNQLEYFAELSCMLFARCNYAPYDGAGLKAYDRQGYEAVLGMWKHHP